MQLSDYSSVPSERPGYDWGWIIGIPIGLIVMALLIVPGLRKSKHNETFECTMRRIPIFELVCTLAILATGSIWIATGDNMLLPKLLFWLVLLALLLSARLRSNLTWLIHICLVVAVLANNIVSWLHGRLSNIQAIAFTTIFLGGVFWVYVLRLSETEEQKGTCEQSSGGAGTPQK